MQQILTERHSGKTRQMTNWSVATFKGKLKFCRFKIVNIILELSTEKLKVSQFLFCLMFRLPRTITSDIFSVFRIEIDAQFHHSTIDAQLVHAFSCALSSYRTLGKFGEHSRS